jgi:hypothetical protein
MHEFLTSKKVLWVFLAIGGAAVLIMIIASLVVKPENQVVSNQQPAGSQQFERTDLPSEQLPAQFPTTLPIEASAKVVDNFNSTANDGTFQATRSYTSVRTPAENFKTFADFFKQDGWTTLVTSDTAAMKSLSVQKGETTIQVLAYTTIDTAKSSMVKVNVTIHPNAGVPTK